MNPRAANTAVLAPPATVEVHVPPRLVPNVGVIIVTWNRRQAVSDVLSALTRQAFPRDRLDVAVIDNASTDGTTEFLREHWSPDRIIDNPTDAADKPSFAPVAAATGPRAHPFRSLTFIRNTHNLGGCGGFNTGLAFIEQFIDDPGREARPDFAWLVDDDVDLPPDALESLVRTAASDPGIGLVGSRTVDFNDRTSTIETTIYYDHDTGWMGPDPAPGHRMHDAHRQWVERIGATKGRHGFTGVRDVDVVSACSLLARWSAVKKVGFWDRRYFIYGDDVDWCLRFARAGYRVVCDLDAVVYHTYWLAKLTPARAYYSERNLLWVAEKTLARRALRRELLRRTQAILLRARKAATHCRLFHAEITRRSIHDAIANRGGKLDREGPPSRPLVQTLRDAGALRPDAEVLVMCSHPESIGWADDLRARITHALIDEGRIAEQPRWTYMVHQGVPDPCTSGSAHQPERIVFASNRRSKWRCQRRYLRRPPDAVVVFDQHNDFPLLRSRCNIHIDRRKPDQAQSEPDGLALRIAFALRWFGTFLRALLYALRARPRAHAGKYG